MPIHDQPPRSEDQTPKQTIVRFALSQPTADADLYRSIIETTPSALLVIDDRGVIVVVNRRLGELFGYSQDELLGQSVERLLPERYRTRHAVLRGSFLRNPENRAMGAGRDLFGLHRDGHEVPIEIGLNPMRIGEQMLVLALIVDISLRKQREQERIHSELEAMQAEASRQAKNEAVMRLLIDHAPVALAMFDLEMRYLVASRRWRDDYHLGDLQLSGVSHYEIFPEIPERWKEVHRRAFAGEVIEEEADRFTRNDGSEQWLRWAVHPWFQPDGSIGGIVIFAEDTTAQQLALEERRQLDAQLQQTQKLESLGALAGGIAHDFNNLLTSIIGHDELALHSLAAGTSAHGQVSKSLSASRRAADLVKQLLAYVGKAKIQMQPLDINELIRQTSDLLRFGAGKRSAVGYDLGDELPPVMGDAVQLQQVIMNLVINADEAIGEREGTITIRTEASMLSEDDLHDIAGYPLAAGRYIVVTVSDSGSGMSEEVRRHIFEPFFTTKFTGRGLGLSCVLGIIRSHGGALDCQSELRTGTQFTIVLPSCTTANAVATAGVPAMPAPTPALRTDGRVLVIDDEEAVRELIRDQLTMLGFTVDLAAGGREGVSCFKRTHHSLLLVIVDLNMPELDGEATITAMRALDQRVPIILCSGQPEPMVAARLIALGRISFLSKPFDMAAMNEALRLVSAS